MSQSIYYVVATRAMLSMCLMFGVTATLIAHDTWVETNTNIIRSGDAVYVDLRLGNHGNEHRDFKLASKIDLASCTLEVMSPGGKSYDLKPSLRDTGYAPKEGYWQGKFVAAESGLHLVAHTLDKVIDHGTAIRARKSGKTFFVVSESLDRVTADQPGFDRILGHPLELVPVVNPVTPMGPGKSIAVRVLLHGKPLSNARVTFVPRGETLTEGFDAQYERTSDAQGEVSFTPKTGNQYLVVVHHRDENARGKDYDQTAYSATLTVFVPEMCPCCQ